MEKEKVARYGLLLLLIAALLFLFFLPFKHYREGKKPFIVRVRIARDVQEASISSKGRCNIISPDTGQIFLKDVPLPIGTQVILGENSIIVAGTKIGKKKIRFTSPSKKDFKFNGTLYHGEIDMIRGKGGLTVINRVEIEDYLKGVIPKEVNNFWPMSALKAQAIASRSFAVSRALRRKKEAYDLTADIFSQVYGGRSAERWRTTRAVETTAGRVLEYNGKLVPGYFHSCCGGHTEDITRVWGGPTLPPLGGVKSPWCRWSPYFRWRVKIPTRTIMEKLNARGYYFTKINDIREGPRDSSGRMEYIRIKSGNKWFEVPIRDFLDAVGRRSLKSENFKIKKYPFFYMFSGYGWGHGVGLCQWCAFSLSVRWWNEKRILAYFYPGSSIVDMRGMIEK